MHTHTHMHTHTCTHTHTCIHAHMHAHTHTDRHMHTHTHTCIHTHTHMHARMFSFKLCVHAPRSAFTTCTHLSFKTRSSEYFLKTARERSPSVTEIALAGNTQRPSDE